mmetsp:Transcript_70672/g.127319  ORF Transcript_70672/g.127319 Transcript_70672/m.127319 type:complete len:248 (+) Transcript_70672:175-918(+)
MARLLKSCLTGPRGGSASVDSPPVPTESLKEILGEFVGSMSAKHLSSTEPRPFAFLKEQPPRPSDTDFGRRTILNSTGTPMESSNGGDTFSLSVVFRTRASTVQRTRKTLLETLKTRCSTGARGAASAMGPVGTAGRSPSAAGVGAGPSGAGGMSPGHLAKRSTGTPMTSGPAAGTCTGARMPGIIKHPAGKMTMPTICGIMGMGTVCDGIGMLPAASPEYDGSISVAGGLLGSPPDWTQDHSLLGS